jgi:DNA replication and repair protein RecF
VEDMIGEKPVLLLDDVLSELDSTRQNYLLKSLYETQTIITCTGLDDFVKNRFRINKVFEVVSGTVTERNE